MQSNRKTETQSTAKLEALTPGNSQLIFIDHQPQMAFRVQSIDRQTLRNTIMGRVNATRPFEIPTIIATVEIESFAGHTLPERRAVFPAHPILERTSMASWGDAALIGTAVRGIGCWP